MARAALRLCLLLLTAAAVPSALGAGAATVATAGSEAGPLQLSAFTQIATELPKPELDEVQAFEKELLSNLRGESSSESSTRSSSSSSSSWLSDLDSPQFRPLFSSQLPRFDMEAASFGPRLFSKAVGLGALRHPLIGHQAIAEQLFEQQARLEQIMKEYGESDALKMHHAMLDELVGQFDTAQDAADMPFSRGLQVLADAAKHADLLHLDLDVLPERANTGQALPVGTLVVNEGAGAASAQLDLEFSANDEDTKHLLCATAGLLARNPIRAGLHSNDKVAQGVGNLIDAMSSRMRELSRQEALPATSQEAAHSTSTGSDAALTRPGIGGVPGAYEAIVTKDHGAACMVALLALIGMVVSGVMMISAIAVLVCSVSGRRCQLPVNYLCRENEGIPVGAIVCAADEEVPGFAAHAGINYVPLPSQQEAEKR